LCRGISCEACHHEPDHEPHGHISAHRHSSLRAEQ
jgi:hypothetical protein